MSFRRPSQHQLDGVDRQSVLMRKRQTEVECNNKHATTSPYSATPTSDITSKRPMANGGAGRNSSPACEPLMAAERRQQLASNDQQHHVVAVRCWPNNNGNASTGNDVTTLTSCSTFKMAAAPECIFTRAGTTAYSSMQQTSAACDIDDECRLARRVMGQTVAC